MKKLVPNCRSRSSIVSPADRVGRTTTRSHAYTSIVHTNSGRRIHVMPAVRMLWIVTMKLIAPASDAAERMWRPRIQ